jgi:hypothetical protein
VEFYTSLSFLNPMIYLWRNFEFPELRVKYWQTFRWNPFIGLIPLLGFLVTLRFARKKLAQVMAWSVVVIWVILHLMNVGPIYRLINGLPGYDALEHARLLIVLPFPMILASAYGIDWLLDEGAERWREFRWLYWLAWLAIPFMVILLFGLMFYFAGQVAALSSPFAGGAVWIGVNIFADYYSIMNPLFLASIGFGLVALVMIYQLRDSVFGRETRDLSPLLASNRMNRIGWLLVALVAAEMLIFAKVNVASTQSDNLYPVTPAIAFLQERAQDEIFRIGAAPNTLYEGRREGEYATYRDDHGWFLSSLLPVMIPNSAAMFGLQDVRGYESVYTLAYSEYLARADGRDTPFDAVAIPTNNTLNPMFDALNMRYVLSIEALDDPALTEVYSGEIFIYQNENALPRAVLYGDFRVLDDAEAVLDRMAEPDFDPSQELLFENDPGIALLLQNDPESCRDTALMCPGEAVITLYEPERVVIEVETSGDAILMLSDLYYPGWVARVDGTETPIARANTIMRAVMVPAGAHEVEFRYESAVIRDGGRISLVSFTVMVIILAGLAVVEVYLT